MNKITLALCTVSAVATSSPSYADLQVRFIEGAPKDRFVITNVGDCGLGAAQFAIDFAETSAGLIFNTTGSGAGVEVFQPFEVTQGAQYLRSLPRVSDGDQRAMLDMTGLSINDSIAFTIDVDDTKGTRAITVSDSEISGTVVSLTVGKAAFSSVMDMRAQVILATPSCDT